MSTLALVAGCGSADRVEVSGVVRDGRTGSPLAGARVTGADGVATHTDAEGRFTLAVMRGLRTQLRVSAEGHADAVQSFGVDAFVTPAVLAFELEPIVVEEPQEETDPDAVVRWSTAEWVAQRFSRGHAEAQHDAREEDGGAWIDGGSREGAPRRPCPALLESDGVDTPPWSAEDVPMEVGGRPMRWLGAGARCVECHRDGSAGWEANEVASGPHADLGDSCMSCHAEDGAAEPRACARCHGDAVEGVGPDTNREWHVEQVAVAAPTYAPVVERARRAMERRLAPPMLGRWIEHGAGSPRADHDPETLARIRALPL
ncbi:MAG: carboxypeptidase regulatory-like domain-containing protein [Sandaracinaceae bacterium]|nr:carboxypeptidase regulatory-like domain-containing protein [Sandaracinaceae bacterium]